MRRKTFEVLFEPGAGMAAIAKQPSLWRSAFYFTLSFSFFGVATNCWLLEEPLEVRFAIIIATVLFAAWHYGNFRCAGWGSGRAHLSFGIYNAAVSAAHAGCLAGRQDGTERLTAVRLLVPRRLSVDAVSFGALAGGCISCRCLSRGRNRSIQPVFTVYRLHFTVAGLPDASAINKI